MPGVDDESFNNNVARPRPETVSATAVNCADRGVSCMEFTMMDSSRIRAPCSMLSDARHPALPGPLPR